MKHHVDFTYTLPGDNVISVLAEIEPGYPARVDCLPEDAYPAESSHAELVQCFIDPRNNEDADEAIEFFPEGLYLREFRKTKLRCLVEILEEQAVINFEEGE